MGTETQQYDQGQAQGYGAPMNTVMSSPMYMDANVIAIQLDSSEIINDVEHYLRSEFYNKATSKWERKPHAEPLMNEYGINSLLAILRPHVDKNHSLTYYTEEQIFQIIMKNLELDLIQNIRDNWYEYGIVNKATASLIVDIMVNTTFASVMRSREGITLDVQRNTQKISYNTAQNNNRRGLLGAISGIFGR